MPNSTAAWPMVPLGDLLERVVRPVRVERDQQYQEIGIRSHCKGIFHKPPTTGKTIGSKRVFWVEPGCLVFNIIFAWEQAVALTTERECGLIASHRFPMYRSLNGELLPEFAYLYFSSPRGKHILTLASPGGAGRNKTLGQEEFKRLKIPVPPPNEQQRIVEILTTCDQSIRRMRKLIAAKRQLMQGFMQQLLTGKRRFPEFSDQPWPARCLSDIGSFAKGKGFGKSDLVDGDGVPAILYGELYTTYDIAVRRVRSRVSPEMAAKSTQIRRNDILFPSSGETADEIAKPAVYLGPKGAVAGGDVIIFRPHEGDPLFLSFALNAQEAFRYRSRVAQGQSIVHIYRDNLAKHPVPFPSVPEQKQIASALDGIPKEIALLEQQRNLMVTEKRGLMQKLLTGQIRVSTSEANS